MNGHECFGSHGWHWLNEPGEWHVGQDGLVATAEVDSDFWVTTHYGFVRDSGHALLRGVPDEMRLTLTFAGDYREQYDQAGLLLRIDAVNWIKTGVEYVDGEPLISAVVTRDVSDWSVVPLGSNAPVTIELRRNNDTVTIRYGVDGEAEKLLRLAYFPPGIPARAGPMFAAPIGRGFPARFTAFSLDT